MKPLNQTQTMQSKLRVISGWFQGRRIRQTAAQNRLTDHQLAAFYRQPFGQVNTARVIGAPAEQRTPRRQMRAQSAA